MNSAVLLCALLSARAAAAPFVSVCGDPGMRAPPKVLLEGWNFCNRAGRSCSVAPRWADCVGADGVQRVAPAANAAGLPAGAAAQASCDAFTQAKERALGGLCDDAGTNRSFFITAMIKSGAMNASERGRLCGLWCAGKTPNCNAPAAGGAALAALALPSPAPAPAWADGDYSMRQPRVAHEWSAPDGAGGWRGSFSGTYDEGANLSALPTPAEAIAAALSPAPARAGCSLAGTWLGQGDARLAIAVAQAPGAAAFNATCTWAPGAGLPAPWVGAGTVDAADRVALRINGHVDAGAALVGAGGAADLVCWSPAEWWCRGAACAAGAAARCAAVPPPKPEAASSYFGMEWVVRAGHRVHRHVLKTGADLNWIMLYTGPEAATGLKGGYEWDGRGAYSPSPQSTTRNGTWDPAWGLRPPNNFQVVQWVNLTLWPGGPGFYWLNMGACWRDDGTYCDGDITQDVTRYLLFQLPAPRARGARCGPAHRALCPPSHRYRNGTVVGVDDANFPFRAYHSVSPRARGADGAFHCKHDCWSNPCDQDWVRLEPAPEWAEYGFPSSVAEAMAPRRWVLDVGGVTAAASVHFSGTPPPLLEWTTLNVGPEMMGPPGTVAVWEVAESDVLIEEGSQGPVPRAAARG